AAADAGVRHLVFGSSAFVYSGRDDMIGADTVADPVLDYGRAKVDAERVLDEIAADSPLTVGSLRLPHVYGPQSLLFSFVRKRFLPFPGRGRNRFAQLHVADAARAMIVAAERRWQGVAPISAGESPTWNEFFGVLEEYAPRVKVVRMPAGFAIAGAAVAGPVLGRVGPTMVTPDTIRGWNLDVAIDAGSVWAELGLEPEHPTVLTGIPSVLDDVVSFRWRHPVADFS
ncbi:MAG: NAD-dependent epimerase/dehydratase family protein, partial [Ilumatobacter sp.]|nr:NAD-dependent epimerase/dehydratase family protein [Ilumatobacter sp.]